MCINVQACSSVKRLCKDVCLRELFDVLMAGLIKDAPACVVVSTLVVFDYVSASHPYWLGHLESAVVCCLS